MATKKENPNEKETTAPKAEQTAADSAAENAVQDPQKEADKIIAEARAKADEILAAAKAEAASVGQAKAPAPSPKPAVARADELVPVRLFKDNDKYKDDVFVAVNGERVQIRRGETVYIKRKFAEVLEQSMKQDTATANMIERKSAEYEAKAKALNI